MALSRTVEQIRDGIEFCLKNDVDVIVLSLGPASTEFNPDDPLQLATKAAYDQDVSVVIAAGNFGAGKMQSLARAPWVISVGAVDENQQLLASSGTGASSREGPTVVSYGAAGVIANPDPQWDHFGPGTSFAAPKVASVAAFSRACIRLMIANLFDQQKNTWSVMSPAVKVPIVGVVDTGVDRDRLAPLAPIAQWDIEHGHTAFSFSRSREEQQWYAQVVQLLKDAGANCALDSKPDTIRRALQTMATPLPLYAQQQVGAGLISMEGALAFFSALTPSRWINMFSTTAAEKIGAERLASLDQQLGALWSVNHLMAMRQHYIDGIRLVVAKVI